LPGLALIGGTHTGSGLGGFFSSEAGTGLVARTLSGSYHAQFGFVSPVSAIDRVTGNLVFVGTSADANRAAQLTGLRGVNYGAAQSLTTGQQTQARANIDAEQAGAAAAVAGDLTTHEGLTGTAVHGLGTIATQAADNVAITGGAISGITDLAIADGGTGASTVDGARANLGFAAVALPAIELNHAMMTFANTDVVGDFAGETVRGIHIRARTMAENSRGRYAGSYQQPVITNGTTRFANWTRKVEFYCHIRSIEATGPVNFARMIYGKGVAAGFGLVASGDWIGFGINGTSLVEGYVCKAGVVTTVALTSVIYSTSVGLSVFIESQNGTVNWYANGVLVGTSSAGPVASNTTGVVGLEVESSGAGSLNYDIICHSFSKGY
jgi:hypothetical protein